jgi:hypothetical protein
MNFQTEYGIESGLGQLLAETLARSCIISEAEIGQSRAIGEGGVGGEGGGGGGGGGGGKKELAVLVEERGVGMVVGHLGI